MEDIYWNRFLGRNRKIEDKALTSDSEDVIIGPAKVVDNPARKVDYKRKERDRKHRKEVRHQHQVERKQSKKGKK